MIMNDVPAAAAATTTTTKRVHYLFAVTGAVGASSLYNVGMSIFYLSSLINVGYASCTEHITGVHSQNFCGDRFSSFHVATSRDYKRL